MRNSIDDVQSAVRRVIESNVTPGSAIVVAISGGQDSCSLLHVLSSLQTNSNCTLFAAHLNHGFRGEDADRDAQFVRDFATSLGVQCIIERHDVPAMARRLHLSAQAAGRRARLDFLGRVAETTGGSWIALGHTKDDHVETILLNIIRGSGTDGLRGLSVVSSNRIRPLLQVTRAQTAAYCRSHGIDFRDDISNASTHYRRNRLRSELLPELETYYNPAIRDALTRLSVIAGDEVDFMDQKAASALDSATISRLPGRLVISSDVLAEMHRAVARRVLRLGIERIRGDLADVEFESIDRILELSRTASAKENSMMLPHGDTAVSVRNGTIEITALTAHAEFRPFERELTVPGTTVIAELGIDVETSLVVTKVMTVGDSDAMLDADRVVRPLVLRNRRTGDRMQPLGMKGTKKIQDILTDRKVPTENRDRIPIIADAIGIVWVAGHALSERVRISDTTTNALRITIRPDEQGLW